MMFMKYLATSCAIGITVFWNISCVPLTPTNREFHTVAAYDGPAAFEGEITAEDALVGIPGDPDFQQLEFDRTLSPSLLQEPGGAYLVGPGDVLDIEVAENVNTRAKTKVMPDGMLYYDVAPGVNVKGKNLKEISTLLSHKLQDDYVDPVVTVNIANADSQRFWLLGQLERPGAYPIKKPTTLINAISQGGGLLFNRDDPEVSNPESADLERAILIRNGDLVPVDFEALVTKGDMSQNVYLRSGDYIFVPSLTKRSLYVLGHVNNPGPVFYEKDPTVLSVVAAAGGARPEAIVTKALIIRGGLRTPQVAVVNIREIMRGREPDLALKGGDIVWVPRSPWTKLKNYTEAVLVTAAQAVAVQEGLGALGATGGADVAITAGGNNN